MAASSPLSNSSDRCCTDVMGMPKLLELLTKPEMSRYMPMRPMPAGPSKWVVSLLRTTLMSMFSPCTPPKMPVYLRIWSMDVRLLTAGGVM